MNRILFIPSVKQGNGTGHLARCVTWARSIGQAARSTQNDAPCTAALYFPRGNVGSLNRKNIEKHFDLDTLSSGNRRGSAHADSNSQSGGLLVDTVKYGDWDVAVLDNFQTSIPEHNRLTGTLPSVAVDEGGPARTIASYLVDCLPSLSRHAPNVAHVGFLGLPAKKRDFDRTWNRILVSFGGEDPADLSGIAVQCLLQSGYPAENISVIVGPVAQERTFPEGVTVVPAKPGLAERLCQYDMAVTSFGLTAFEAIAVGIAVVLINPTRYHHTLARSAGFPSAGWGAKSRHRLRKLVSMPEAVSGACSTIDVGTSISFAEFLNSLDFNGDLGCPVCRSKNRRAESRQEDRTIFRCRACGIHYQVRFRPDHTTYTKDYFFSDYSRQYGKTYLQDFDHIRDMGRKRMRIIGQLTSKRSSRTILDVGCAYGPFLAAAGEAAWKPFGLDISAEAARYVQETLAIPCHAGDFLSADIEECFSVPSFGAVTMWYVIEHFPDVASVLEKVSRLVEPGGLFCFATPNLRGISGLRNKKRFLAGGPPDHYTIWSPRSARSVLSRFGLTVVVVRNTGHHPERFPGPVRLLGPLYRLLSGVFRLGDTFEVYAIKT